MRRYLNLLSGIFMFSLSLLTEGLSAQIFFVENKGQWPQEVLFRADIPDGYLSVEANALVYTRLYTNNPEYFHHGPQKGDTLIVHNQRIELEGGNLSAQGLGKNKRTEYHNYFLGNDPSKWASKVSLFEKVVLYEVYPGIDMEIYGRGTRSVKYDFIVHPGADPGLIVLHYQGQESLALKNKNLHVQTAVGEIIEEAPFAYQLQGKNIPNIEARYKLDGDRLRFVIGDNYQPSQALIIDPVVVFSTYTGSSSDNFGFTATYDFLGHGFAGGDVRGFSYPSTPGVVQTFFHDGTEDLDDVLGDVPRDCAIMKLSPDGKTKVWATFLGGSRNEQPHSMVVDSKNNLVIMGSTFSTDFPNDGQGFSRNNKGNCDIFVIKIREDGTQILGMSYLGGSGRDGLNGRRPFSQFEVNTSPLHYNFGDEFRGEVIVDKNDNVYIASCTESPNGSGFPAVNSFNTNFGGFQDGCVFKLSPDLRTLHWGAYIGGPNFETAFSLDIDANGNVFVCGGSNSNTMSFSPTALHRNYLGGRSDGYVIKLNNDGNQILGGTFIGTNQYDQCYFVKVDKFGQVYLTGQTAGNITPFPATVYSSATGGQFIYKLSSDLQTLLISTTYGAGNVKPQLSPSAFMVDSCERVFVSGWGGSTNNSPLGNGGNTHSLEHSTDAYDPSTDGSDFYLAVFSKNMTKLLYGTFIGGGYYNSVADNDILAEHVDGGTSRFDPRGIVYQSVCGGCGGSSTPDFPTTPGAYSRTNNSSNCNNALFKLDFENLNAAPEVRDTSFTIMALDTLDFTFFGTDSDDQDSLFLIFEGKALNGADFPKPLIKAGASSVKGMSKVGTSFTWISNCDHVGQDIKIKVAIEDQGCPSFKEDSATITIVVLPPPAPVPPEVICMTFLGEDRLKLTWSLSDTSGYLAYYILYKSSNGGAFVPVDTLYSGSGQEFFDGNVPNHALVDYCYKMIGVNVCGVAGQESYTICSIDQHNKPIEGTEIIVTTVVENKNTHTTWFQSNEPDFKGYTLYKRINDPKSTFEFVKFFENKSDTSYLDTRVKVQEYSYCYALAVKDKCGNNSAKSNPGCSILLQGASIPFQHNLFWNPYQEWEFGVQQYDLWRHDDRYFDTLIQDGNAQFVKTIDTAWDYDWGGYWYKIRATELNGNLAVSESNEIYLVQSPLLHVPTGFTRNGDQLNDVWGISDVFVKDYRLLVYNRWGEKVLETTDKNFQWDGYFRQEQPADNVFIWYVVYTGWDESTHTQKGTLTLLR